MVRVGAVNYNKRLRFILILLVSFLFFHFPLASEGELIEEKKVETLTEDSPVDIIDKSDNGDGKLSQLSEDFSLKNEVETVSYTSNVFRLVLSLVFVVFLAYIVIRFMRKSKLFVVNDDAYLKLVAQLNIEQGKSIKVFTLGDKAYIVGVTNNTITKIAEFEDKVLIDAMNLKASEKPSSEATSFSKVFSNFFPTTRSSKPAESEIFDDEFLKNQQTRIKNINLKNE